MAMAMRHRQAALADEASRRGLDTPRAARRRGHRGAPRARVRSRRAAAAWTRDRRSRVVGQFDVAPGHTPHTAFRRTDANRYWAQRLWRSLLLVPLLTACGVGMCRPSFEPVAADQSGVMIAPRADGIAVECRGVELERCRSGADGLQEVDADDAERIIVSCVGRCTAQGGELRMDAVVEDKATLIANGGYGEFEQSCSSN